MTGLWQRSLPENTQHSQEKNIQAPGGTRTLHPSRQVSADPRLRSCGHRDWPFHFMLVHIKSVLVNIIFVVQRSVKSSVPKRLIMILFHFKILRTKANQMNSFLYLVISYIFWTSALHTQCLTPTCCTKLLVTN